MQVSLSVLNSKINDYIPGGFQIGLQEYLKRKKEKTSTSSSSSSCETSSTSTSGVTTSPTKTPVSSTTTTSPLKLSIPLTLEKLDKKLPPLPSLPSLPMFEKTEHKEFKSNSLSWFFIRHSWIIKHLTLPLKLYINCKYNYHYMSSFCSKFTVI